MVIIGNEFKASEQTVENLSDSQETNSDLYIVLAALELDAVMKLYIHRLKKKHRQNVTLPIVIQEVYNATTVNFLPDEYVYFQFNEVKPWFKLPRNAVQNSRGVKMTNEDESEENDPSEGFNIAVRVFKLPSIITYHLNCQISSINQTHNIIIILI